MYINLTAWMNTTTTRPCSVRRDAGKAAGAALIITANIRLISVGFVFINNKPAHYP